MRENVENAMAQEYICTIMIILLNSTEPLSITVGSSGVVRLVSDAESK
jgi:hypothetical protein